MSSGSCRRSANRVTGWRKLAGTLWSAPSDPQFYGDLEIDAADATRYVDELRRTTGVHVTLTHIVVKAVALGLEAVPMLNERLAFGRRYPRESIDVFVIVAISDDELTGVKVRDANHKSVVEIARDLERQADAIRRGEDPHFGRTKAMLEVLPPRLLRLGMRLGALLTSDLNLDLPQLGLPRQAFGSAMVSAIGGTGISHAYSPLAPHYRVPLLVLVGSVAERAVVVSGRIVARPVLPLTATFDHRYSDGLAAAAFGKVVAAYLRDPESTGRDVHIEIPEQRADTLITH